MNICPKHNEPIQPGSKACEACFRELFGKPAHWEKPPPERKRPSTTDAPKSMRASMFARRSIDAAATERIKRDH